MEGTPQTEGMSASEILGFAGKADQGKRLEDYNPLETIPTLGVGDLSVGQVLCGTFVMSEVIASPKFKYAREKNDKGVPIQTRHVLENGGKKFGIWSVGELKLIFGKLTPGTYVALTYNGLGEVNGNDQHRFSCKVASN